MQKSTFFNWDIPPWETLRRLRDGFLAGDTKRDYWRSESDLAAYDATFAERIGWKWDSVLDECKDRGWLAGTEALPLVDWGCGTGVASRRVLASYGAKRFTTLSLLDRSPLATRFAARRIQELYPSLKQTKDLPTDGYVLLASHVVTELTDTSLAELGRLAAGARAFLWVEPGTPAASRQIIAMRESLRTRFRIVAPCPHQTSCGLLKAERAADWCHNFAAPPAEVFQSAHWQRFGRELGIDLRSLPVSFLALDSSEGNEACDYTGMGRVLGRARSFKPYVESLVCEQSGVEARRLLRRMDKRFCKDLERASFTELHPLDKLGPQFSSTEVK